MNLSRTILVAALGAVPGAALAQPFTITWSGFDCGGATSIAAGAYTLGGSIGQPLAGQVSAGTYSLVEGFWGGSAASCYANCDGSTTPPALNVLDFACFLNRFAAGDPYANCDSSTTPPVLNVLDFACFLNRFAAGCS